MTTTDVLMFVSALPGVPRTQRDIDEPWSDAAALMGDRGIQRVLVTENERLVGIVTALDIAAACGRASGGRPTSTIVTGIFTNRNSIGVRSAV